MKYRYAILLVRVSTYLQDYEPQIEDLKKYAKLKGFNKFKVIATKESGLIDSVKKIGINELFTFIEENPNYNVVFATEISRLGRRQSILHSIKEWFVKRRVQFYAKDTGYALLDDNGQVAIAGEVMFTLYGLMAESEINQKKHRFLRAKQMYMEKGLSISGKTLFGYERIRLESGKTTLQVHPENSKIVRMIYNWYINGIDNFQKNASIKNIALECIKRGYPKYTHSKRNVNKLLKEEGYTGFKVTNNKRKNLNFDDDARDEKYIITKNKIKYPIIIDSDTFNNVREKLKEKNISADKSTVHCTILSKTIKCNKCSSFLTANYRVVKKRNVSSYRCASRSGMRNCENKQSISMSMIDSAIWSFTKSSTSLLNEIIDTVSPDQEIEMIKSQLNELKKRKSEIASALNVLNQSINNISNVNPNSFAAIFNTIENKIITLDKEDTDLDNEITRLNILANFQTNSKFKDDLSRIAKDSKRIEKSKELIKKCINTFIESIEIVLQTSKYSILKINYKKFSIGMLSQKNRPSTFNNRFILINKSVTRNIEVFSLPLGLELSVDKKSKVSISNHKSVTLESFKIENLNEIFLSKYLRKLQYNTLKF